VDLESNEVAHHEQRRIFQILTVFQQLDVGSLQVLVRPFVLPAEEPALPHIGIALVIANLVDILLKRVSLGIGMGRVRLVQDVAEIVKVGLCARALA